VAAELVRKSVQHKHGNPRSILKDAEFLAGRLYPFRCIYLSAAASEGPTPLTAIQTRPGDNRWYRQAAGKGVLCLHALREYLGLTEFLKTMNAFGTANAGKELTTTAFVAHSEKETGKPVGEFLKPWLEGKELPAVSLGNYTTAHKFIHDAQQAVGERLLGNADKATLIGELLSNGQAPLTVKVIHNSDKGETSATVQLVNGKGAFEIPTDGNITKRFSISPDDAMFCNPGTSYALSSFMEELEKTLIVYGSGEERASNLEAAQELQRAIITQHSNLTVPYKSDKEVSEDELSSHHLLLIGRPDNNSVVAAMAESLPVTFGPRSFKVQNATYANAGSAVLAAAPNRLDKRYSVVVIAGLGAEATFHAAPGLMNRGSPTQVMILPARAGSKSVVVIPAAFTKHPVEAPRITRSPATGGSGN
jgi:hypothetical protein